MAETLFLFLEIGIIYIHTDHMPVQMMGEKPGLTKKDKSYTHSITQLILTACSVQGILLYGQS